MSLSNKDKKDLDFRLQLGIALNTLFTIVEFFIGFFSGSLALISDAAHNLTDVLSLIISFTAQKLSLKQPDNKKTFGYGRITILAALLNIMILFILTLYIFIEIYQRFYEPESISGTLVTITSLVGIIVNGGIALLFLKYKSDLNIKSSLTNMIFDAIASAGAFVSGIIITLTNNTFIDLIISSFIGLMLIFNIFKLLKEVIHILLEGAPEHINVKQVKKEIEQVDLVKKAEHLHIWSISSYNVSLSCHIIIDRDKLDQSIEIVQKVKDVLKNRFNITHATIEVNTEICDKNGCSLVYK